MTSRFAGGTSGLIQRVNDILDTDLKRLGSLSKRAAGRLLSTNWRHALRPRHLFAWDDDDGQPRRHSTTAWLDGARGVSALQVCIFHFVVNGYAIMGRTYGATPEDNHYHQHPLLRPIWNAGAASVCNFFIISGYALTINSFVLMREGKYDELYRGLCSSVLRRWFRLWLPVIVCAIPMIFLFQYWPYTSAYQPMRRDSLGEEITNFLHRLDDMAQPLPFMNKNGIGWAFEYVNQAWTIPLEFHCSMVCYLTVMLVSRIPVFRHRIAIIGFLAFYAMHHAIFWTCLFLVGMILAEWNLEQHYRQQTQTTALPLQPPPTTTTVTSNSDSDHSSNNTNGVQKQSRFRSRRISIWTLFNWLVFFTGYYLSGMPMQNPTEDPYIPKIGYETLYALQPPKWLFNIDFELRWYQSLSACCLIYSISQSPFLRSLFETRFCQWLGKLSFSLYLVHVQIMGMFAGHLRLLFRFLTGGREGLVVLMFVYEMVILGFIVFAAAAIVWRNVDKPTVRFSRWLDEVFTGRRRHHGAALMVGVGAGAGAAVQELGVLQASRVESSRNH